MLQTGSATSRTTSARLPGGLQAPALKPFLDGETRYENSHRNFGMPCPGAQDPGLPRPPGRLLRHALRRAGHTYGCRDVWSFYVPSDRPPDALRRHPLGGPSTSRGREQLRHWRTLFESYPWYRLVPDLPDPRRRAGAAGAARGAALGAALRAGLSRGRLVTQGAWDGTNNVRTPAAVAADASFALVYLPLPMPLWVDLDRIASPGAGRRALVRPAHGRGALAGATPGGRWARGALLPPGDETAPDWVLVLRAVGNTEGQPR